VELNLLGVGVQESAVLLLALGMGLAVLLLLSASSTSQAGKPGNGQHSAVDSILSSFACKACTANSGKQTAQHQHQSGWLKASRQLLAQTK
jgi:hypothetical protein